MNEIRTGSLASNALEDVVHERVQNSPTAKINKMSELNGHRSLKKRLLHGFVGDTSIRVHLLKHSINIDA